MCGIGAILQLDGGPVGGLDARLATMNRLLAHRGPDGEGVWMHPAGHVGFAHRRLEIIDLSTGDQPMTRRGRQLDHLQRRDLQLPRAPQGDRRARIPHDLRHRGRASRVPEVGTGVRRAAARDVRVRDLGRGARAGSSARAIASGSSRSTYAVVDGTFICASEAKALLPFLPAIETDVEALKDYLAFQFCLAGKTLFKGVEELLPGHTLTIRNGVVRTERYWEVQFEPDFDHTRGVVRRRSCASIIEESVAFHLRADVPVGAYLSGGLDSSITAALAARMSVRTSRRLRASSTQAERYDESRVCPALADEARLHGCTRQSIGARDFVENIHEGHLPPRLSRRRPGLVPAVHGVAARGRST